MSNAELALAAVCVSLPPSTVTLLPRHSSLPPPPPLIPPPPPPPPSCSFVRAGSCTHHSVGAAVDVRQLHETSTSCRPISEPHATPHRGRWSLCFVNTVQTSHLTRALRRLIATTLPTNQDERAVGGGCSLSAHADRTHRLIGACNPMACPIPGVQVRVAPGEPGSEQLLALIRARPVILILD